MEQVSKVTKAHGDRFVAMGIPLYVEVVVDHIVSQTERGIWLTLPTRSKDTQNFANDKEGSYDYKFYVSTYFLEFIEDEDRFKENGYEIGGNGLLNVYHTDRLSDKENQKVANKLAAFRFNATSFINVQITFETLTILYTGIITGMNLAAAYNANRYNEVINTSRLPGFMTYKKTYNNNY